jgi:DNA-binding NtrC family response regulator
MQSKLLRAVQEQTFIPVGCHHTVSVNTRFICATNRNLHMEVAAGRFRQDLFYRLGVIHVELPPLRERGEDVVLLADKFLKLLDDRQPSPIGFSEQTLKVLREYHWPGNIRELRNAIERSFVLRRGDLIEPADLPETLRADRGRSVPQVPPLTLSATEDPPAPGLPAPSQQSFSRSRTDALKAAEHQYLIDLMRAHDGNVSVAARHADLSRQGLHKLLKTYGINPARFRS